MSSSNKLPLIFFFASLLFQMTLGEIICEELSKEVCAFSISSSGRRCLLENMQTNKGVEYQCTTSDVIVQRMAEHIETDACVDACGVDRNTVGISSDSLLEQQFTARLCSAFCYHNCPNIIDLYFNLAAGEGVFLPDLCEKQKNNPHHAMQNLMNYVHIRALSSNYDVEDDAPSPSPSSESDGTEADAPALSGTSNETEEDAPSPSDVSAENEDNAPAPSSEEDITPAPSSGEDDAPAPSSEENDATAPSSEEDDATAPSSEEDNAIAPSSEEDIDATSPSSEEDDATAPSSETAENENNAPSPSFKSVDTKDHVPSLLSGSDEDGKDAPVPSSEIAENEKDAPSSTPRSINDEAEEDTGEVEEDEPAPSYY